MCVMVLAAPPENREKLSWHLLEVMHRPVLERGGGWGGHGQPISSNGMVVGDLLSHYSEPRGRKNSGSASFGGESICGPWVGYLMSVSQRGFGDFPAKTFLCMKFKTCTCGRLSCILCYSPRFDVMCFHKQEFEGFYKERM